MKYEKGILIDIVSLGGFDEARREKYTKMLNDIPVSCSLNGCETARLQLSLPGSVLRPTCGKVNYEILGDYNYTFTVRPSAEGPFLEVRDGETLLTLALFNSPRGEVVAGGCCSSILDK